MQEVIEVSCDIFIRKQQFELANKWMNLRTDEIIFGINILLSKIVFHYNSTF